MVKTIKRKSVKILIITAVFPPEPVVSAMLSFNIATEMTKENTVTVISPPPSRPFGFHFTGEKLSFDFKHVQTESFICPTSRILCRFRESLSFGIHSYNYISKNHSAIDLIYANTWPLLGQFFAVRAAQKYKIPIILHVQDIYPESLTKKISFASSILNRIIVPLDKYILSRSSKIIAISEKMKSYLLHTRHLQEDKIEVIRNWQDETAFINTERKKLDGDFTFMYLGNISPAAGLPFVINAFQKANLPKAKLIIAGNGSDLKNCIEIANKGNDLNIHFMDAPPHLVPSIQSSADVLILPLKKGIGLTASPSKLPAYMFSAKPIIASVDEESDTADVIRKANCGWLVEPEDIDSMVATIIKARNLPKEDLLYLGDNGYNYSIRNFSKRVNLEKFVSLIIDQSKN